MKSGFSAFEATSCRCSLITAAVAFGLMLVLAFAQTGLAQTTPPLNFSNNYFVTGDYVVAGVGLRGLGDSTGYATGTITMPDYNTRPAGGVPTGAQVVAALLYWQTVESSQTAFAGQMGFFRPVFPGGPSTGYPIFGAVLGNPNAPVSWSSGGCSGNSQGSKTIRAYRADVRPFLHVDSNGNVVANGAYEVRLADSGSNGGGAPLTLGATLVIIYRMLDKSVPLDSVVIYDGSFAPSNSSSDMTLPMQGFYQAAASPIAKLTQIVGNGQSNKYETVYLNRVNLPSLYGALSPPFPGYYHGSWDNPTWIVNTYGNAVKANDPSEMTSVVPAASNSGCVSWGAVIFSTTVQDTDHDGLLDVWEKDKGYCDASINGGQCTSTDPGWVSLSGADPNKKDIFVQMDYMCSIVNPDGTCDTANGYSFLPKQQAQTMMTNAFALKGINLHLIPGNAIQETTCTDDPSASPPQLCPVPNQPGVVGWKGGFTFLKNQPININPATGQTYTETECEQNPTACVRRFQHGRKDSYHYALFGHALSVPMWTFLGGTLKSVVASGNTVTFTTSTPHGLVANDTLDGNGRVAVSDAISNPGLDGTFYVQSVPTPTSFTIQINNPASGTDSLATDPDLSVTPGEVGTTSGASDIGGEDSAITLGLWGPDGQAANVQAGVFMHELGHTLGLTHGGFYYDTAGSYVPTAEPNCKANYQSVMNYLFTVDLLGPNQTLDYSEQKLSTLNENSLPAGVTTTDGSSLAYSTTSWYAPSSPEGVGTAANLHCDGTPILSTDPQPSMYLLQGLANPISPAWMSPQDITFNGDYDSSLRGYDDWANTNLRQMGALGDLSTAGGPGQLSGLGPGQLSGLGPGQLSGLGPGQLSGLGPGQLSGLGPGHGEITLEAANSATRPPRNLTATMGSSPISIKLRWTSPTFGQIGTYNIYRGVDGAAPAPPYYATVPAPSTPR